MKPPILEVNDGRQGPPTRFFYRYRGLLLAPPLLFALVCHWAETEIDWLVFPVGLSLFAIGVAVRFWAQCHLHYRLRQRKQLTTTGPYRYVRNPIYLANTFIVCGLCIVSELIWLTPFMVLWTVFVYRRTVRYEEYHLTQKYGLPYVAFLGTVPRWIPRMAGLAKGITPDVRPFLTRSVWAEAHNLIILAPFLLKELIY